MAKKNLRNSFFFLLGLIALMSIIFFFIEVEPQQKLVQVGVAAPRTLDSLAEAQHLEDLRVLYGEGKDLPEGYELQALLALSRFPEIQDLRIRFRVEKAFVPIASRPHFPSMFRSKGKWVYDIIISNKSADFFEPILFHNLSFNAQVGILAHELSHCIHYRDYNLLQMLKFGWLYLVSGNFRATHERSTDEQAVYHGFGRQLYDYAWFVRYDSTTAASYREDAAYVDRFYLRPHEVEQLMRSLAMYDATVWEEEDGGGSSRQ
jgi:hypothetical protein